MANFDEYLKKCVASDAWSSTLEIKALCRKFDVRCILFSDSCGVDPVLFHGDGKRGYLCLWHSGSCHFDLLTGGNPKSVQTRPYRGLDDIVRGGGAHDFDDAASFQTVWSASGRNSSGGTQWTAVQDEPAPAVVTPLPSSSCSPQSSCLGGPVNPGRGVPPSEGLGEQSGVKTVWTSLPANKDVVRRRLHGKCHAPWFNDCKRSSFSVEAHSAAADLGDDDLCIDDFVEDTTGLSKRELFHRRGSKFAVDANIFRWKCDVCPFVIEAKHHEAVCKARYHHNKNAHGGAGQPGRLSRPNGVVAEGAEGPLFWRCPLCSFGISAEMRAKISFRVYMEEVRGHRASHHSKVKLAC